MLDENLRQIVLFVRDQTLALFKNTFFIIFLSMSTNVTRTDFFSQFRSECLGIDDLFFIDKMAFKECQW